VLALYKLLEPTGSIAVSGIRNYDASVLLLLVARSVLRTRAVFEIVIASY